MFSDFQIVLSESRSNFFPVRAPTVVFAEKSFLPGSCLPPEK
jgi:hypothetical protein